MFVVGVAHCVTKMSPREFNIPLLRYCKIYEIKEYVFDELSSGITSIQYFSNIGVSVLLL
jgi:hypothetical protein